MSKINIKLASDETLAYIKANLDTFTDKVINNEDNTWLESTIKNELYVDKTYKIEDFTLLYSDRPGDSETDYKNGITLYNSLKGLPRYILTDIRFWLWLILDKFYKESKSFMKINGKSTIKDHWIDGQPRRRALFFNVLARLFFRVELTIDGDDLTLTKWIYEAPERFRNLTWRNLSNNRKVVVGILKGCKKAADEKGDADKSIYAEIAKYLDYLGSATLLDSYSVDELSSIVYQKMIELIDEKNE